jgi:hypothetical protein
MKQKWVKFPYLTIVTLAVFSLVLTCFSVFAGSILSERALHAAFPIISKGRAVSVCVSREDFPGVIRAVNQLKTDLGKISGNEPALRMDVPSGEKYVIMVGTLGKSKLIEQLILSKKLDVSEIKDKWESTLIQVVEKPFPGIKKALVIVGSDKRGTIFGIYDLTAKAGVSPWVWWADMPVKHHENLYVNQLKYILESPKVKYRGIFINDEAPALSGWVTEKFGGFNHQFYEHVFELILRLKGNFLWPAMWGRAFYDDDPLNPELADEYGVVIGTSHHEPMMRAHDEWRRFGSGPWNYQTNPEVLKKFWREGIIRRGNYESLVTVGMRGDGDAPMSQSADISLLEKIIGVQRTILEQVTGKPASETPQVWALYKEVQDYYDKGMRVPDDVTLMLCDDNWGNVRKLPSPDSPQRRGGYGMYYHFDYVGGPRNYKWLNTNQITRVWEQMNLTWQYGVRNIWIVNVGDIKPMEIPIEFFLDMAWNPEEMTLEKLSDYTLNWAAENFGPEWAPEISRFFDGYTRFNSRRKPELLSPATYSLIHYREAEKATEDYKRLAAEAEALFVKLPAEYRDAYDQLVLFPVKACANLNELYFSAALNNLYARQNRSATNDMAEKVSQLFSADSLLSYNYNHTLSNGKWNHIMDQTHIGYTYWQEPPRNRMPLINKISVPLEAGMSVATEGSEKWPVENTEAVLPEFDFLNKQQYYFEIFNTGSTPFDYSVHCAAPWIKVSENHGNILKQNRIYVEIDWKKAPEGNRQSSVTIRSTAGKEVTVGIRMNNSGSEISKAARGYVENNGCISLEAARFTRKFENMPVVWKEIPGLGKTVSGMTTFPVVRAGETSLDESPGLEYDLWFFSTGKVTIRVYLSPTLNFNNVGLRYAVSLDHETPTVVNFNANYTLRDWEKWVSDNIIISETVHTVNKPGLHVLKFRSMDSGVVLQKIVVDTGGLKPSYLGPPQSYLKP